MWSISRYTAILGPKIKVRVETITKIVLLEACISQFLYSLHVLFLWDLLKFLTYNFFCLNSGFSAMGVMSVKDALREFSIPTVIAYKDSEINTRILQEIESASTFLQPL
jgi:hypothetical protein